MARQKELTGIEKESIKEIDDAAEAYEDVRDRRMALTKEEVERQRALVEAMRRHKRRVYRDDTASPPLLVTLTETEVKVKVKRVGAQVPPTDD